MNFCQISFCFVYLIGVDFRELIFLKLFCSLFSSSALLGVTLPPSLAGCFILWKLSIHLHSLLPSLVGRWRRFTIGRRGTVGFSFCLVFFSRHLPYKLPLRFYTLSFMRTSTAWTHGGGGFFLLIIYSCHFRFLFSCFFFFFFIDTCVPVRFIITFSLNHRCLFVRCTCFLSDCDAKFTLFLKSFRCDNRNLLILQFDVLYPPCI